MLNKLNKHPEVRTTINDEHLGIFRCNLHAL